MLLQVYQNLQNIDNNQVLRITHEISECEDSSKITYEWFNLSKH
jgi:hypothetical protein